MLQVLIGTVGFALILLAAGAWMLITAVRALDDGRDEIAQPHQVAERLAMLTDANAFSSTAQRRAAKKRLELVAERSRGRARLMTFIPKDVA